MKVLLSLILLLPNLTFANCDILVHKSVSTRSLDSLFAYNRKNDILKKTKFTVYSKTPNLGIKEESKLVDTGDRNIFNEKVTVKMTKISIYEEGYVIYTTALTKDSQLQAEELAKKLVELKCE